MAERAKFYAGQLRWSNDRTGLEFAPLDSEKGGDTRRMRRLGHFSETGEPVYGQLLQDDLAQDGYGEGHGVVVIALPSRMSDEDIQRVCDVVRRTFAPTEDERLVDVLVNKKLNDG